ncbi:putative Alcohol dehydrogenase [Vibrio nigripulchritudo MADA3029]|uniref:iron-containing alcohol dehydrogenase n=1 Tax=Vibrio nigripulchritudo TaxID=28173 RepID=UPI0003B2015F|nr:iron-containing alcohol dehydrogenase [Vibrio nigripulchritudo]CCN50554.1 putative Alcohol dehydrogenase [Vibrio nigripulchritudo MADA3020]CCN52504.1 putative Alcohol dehydrogenase [Vibrio nigripulchritudo MADA3021]CCN62332.1 putative Alcohol dehydrogenase [Vibrio nigripulchritudo MADA3029]
MQSQLLLILHKAYIKALKVAAAVVPIPKPTLFMGKDSLKQLCHSVSLLGVKKVLIVTDEGISASGLLEKLEAELVRAGVESFVFKDVTPDPTYDQVEKGLEHYQRERCQGILALGGGSPIDCGKVIAARVTNKKSIKRLTGLFKVWRATAPLFVMPTTSGTGSEVTIAAVVSDPVSHQKTPIMDPKLVPTLVALDPAFSMGLPPHITAHTGMDALTHAVEAYLSVNATAETDAYAKAAITLIHDNLEKAVIYGQNSAVRQNMSLASYYAGLAFTKASLGYVHAISHTIGAKYGTPHGLANAVILPHVLEFSKPAVVNRLADLADLIHVSETKTTESMRAQKFIQYVRDLQVSLNIPANIDALLEEHIPDIARMALHEAQWNYPVPKQMNQEQCEVLIGKILPSA